MILKSIPSGIRHGVLFLTAFWSWRRQQLRPGRGSPARVWRQGFGQPPLLAAAMPSILKAFVKMRLIELARCHGHQDGCHRGNWQSDDQRIHESPDKRAVFQERFDAILKLDSRRAHAEIIFDRARRPG